MRASGSLNLRAFFINSIIDCKSALEDQVDELYFTYAIRAKFKNNIYIGVIFESVDEFDNMRMMDVPVNLNFGQ